MDGDALKAQGMDRASGAVDIEEWKEEFLSTVRFLAILEIPFTSEEVTSIVGLPRKDIHTNANNAVGSMMNSAAKSGTIKFTGRYVKSKRPSSHSSRIMEWIGASHD